MATSQMAAMLDELMGRNRNYDPNDANAKELKWSDNTVCRYYLVQFCPHELFTNTKADLVCVFFFMTQSHIDFCCLLTYIF